MKGGSRLGLPEEIGMTGGIFVDAGSLWGLDVTTAQEDPKCANPIARTQTASAVECAMVTAKSPDFELRAATGFALYWNTAIGTFAFNFTEPLEFVEGVDKTETFRLTIGTYF